MLIQVLGLHGLERFYHAHLNDPFLFVWRLKLEEAIGKISGKYLLLKVLESQEQVSTLHKNPFISKCAGIHP